MRKQLLAVFMASLMVGVTSWGFAADNSVNATIVNRYVDQANVQTYLFTGAAGGGETVGPGRAVDGTYRVCIGSSGANVTQVVIDSATTPSSPTEGGFWNDATQRSLASQEGGMTSFLPGVIYFSTGTTISTTTFPGVLQVSTITSASTTKYGTVTLPANSLVAGKTIRYTVLGTLSTPGIAGGTDMVFAVKLGTTTVGTTGNMAFPAGISSMTFAMEGLLSCVSAGSFVLGVSSAVTTFTVMVASGTTLAPAGDFVVGNSTNNVAQINTTQANDFNIVAGFKSTSAGTVLILNEILYERLN